MGRFNHPILSQPRQDLRAFVSGWARDSGPPAVQYLSTCAKQCDAFLILSNPALAIG